MSSWGRLVSRLRLAGKGADYATIGYDAATGATLWVRRYNGPGNGDDLARVVAVSHDGSKVVVTGRITGTTGGYDYATVAYDASSGSRVWVAATTAAATRRTPPSPSS